MPYYVKKMFKTILTFGLIRGSDKYVSMGSTEPIKFSRRGHKPITGIKSMIFCNLWLQNDGFNCKLLNSMGSK